MKKNVINSMGENMKKTGQFILLIGIIIVMINGILTIFKLVDTNIISGIFVISLILVGIGSYLSKKK